MTARNETKRREYAKKIFALFPDDVVEVEFADAAFIDDDAEDRAIVLGERNYSHLTCAAWRRHAHKRVGVWASAMRALWQASHRTRPSFIFEDDVVLSQSLSVLAPELLRRVMQTLVPAGG